MKHIRYIIGSLAIAAIVTMNFNYARNGYGIKRALKNKVCGTTAAPTYRQEKVFVQQLCPKYVYDVVLMIDIETIWKHPEWGIFPIGGSSRYHGIVPNDKVVVYVKSFIGKNAQEVNDDANYYAQQINALQECYIAKVDNIYHIEELMSDAFYIECKSGGKLLQCQTEAIKCEPLDIDS